MRGTRQLRHLLAGVGVLALLPAVGAALTTSRFVVEECTDLSTAAIGFGLLGMATQRMTGIVTRRDLLLRQREGLAELAQLAVGTSDVEPVRAEAERLLRSQFGDETIEVRLTDSWAPSEWNDLQVVGTRNTVSLGLASMDVQEQAFAEQVLRVVASSADRAHAEDEIRHSSHHHSLTGLPNRVLFLDRLGGQLDSNSATVVVLCGLRGLDDLVAAQGHSVRDEALVAVSHALSAASSTDRVLAYLGGGTFGLIVKVTENASEAAVTAQLADLLKTLHLAVSTSPAAAGRLRAALGTALGRGITAEELLRDATAALTRAVEEGRSFAVYDPELGDRLRRSADTAAQLQHALARDEIEVHYQPVVDTHTRQITSFEALARWRQAATIIGPALWIPTAEATGLIHDIGIHVLGIAARDQSRLNASVGINVSPVQLAADDFADRAIAALGDCPPSMIILEITESAIMADVGHAIGQLQKLRDAGIRIALDDFGTSYSSLSVLADLPLDIVKIDRSFVQRMDQPSGVAIVEAIVAMAYALGKTTVAEGVETAEQFSALAALGVDRIQGFLVAQPMISLHAERWPRARPMPAVVPALAGATA
jgi:diguanylate cyclase (GGDEF)-like protein